MTFDPSVPACWTALGEAAFATLGYYPSPEETMTLVAQAMSELQQTMAQPQAQQGGGGGMLQQASGSVAPAPGGEELGEAEMEMDL